MMKQRYEDKGIQPPFWELPVGNGNGKAKRIA
jgi:hypothetical protein